LTNYCSANILSNLNLNNKKLFVMEKFPITQSGYEKLEQEIKSLRAKGHEIAKAIDEARGHGDLSENAEYHEARKEQSTTQGKILELESKYSRAEIIDITRLPADNVKFGATVGLIDDQTEQEVTYIITGEYEADIAKKRVSIVSPMAKALIGKRVGDIVEVQTPKGIRSYEVVSIEYKEFDV
jgi:transcription elongation factor GreA